MLWSVNNCMLQRDICHPDMQYVFYPAGHCVEECSPQGQFKRMFWSVYHKEICKKSIMILWYFSGVAKRLEEVEVPFQTWILRGGEDRSKLGNMSSGSKLTCHNCADRGEREKNLEDFSCSSSISIPVSPSIIAFITDSQDLPPSVTLTIQKEIKQLTMMIKVTGPIKLHMKWLSTLSQHLQQK